MRIENLGKAAQIHNEIQELKVMAHYLINGASIDCDLTGACKVSTSNKDIAKSLIASIENRIEELKKQAEEL